MGRLGAIYSSSIMLTVSSPPTLCTEICELREGSWAAKWPVASRSVNRAHVLLSPRSLTAFIAI